jgi:hypothetical protein
LVGGSVSIDKQHPFLSVNRIIKHQPLDARSNTGSFKDDEYQQLFPTINKRGGNIGTESTMKNYPRESGGAYNETSIQMSTESPLSTITKYRAD